MFNDNKQIYCLIRKMWVLNTPEEMIRQKTLHYLIQSLGFPSSGILVEKELKSLPHLSLSEEIPAQRRADILCFTARGEGLHPLLLIECKAVKITSKELRQVIGYNRLVKASFIALVNQKEEKLGWFDAQILDYKFIDYFPNYHELINSLVY